MEDMVSIVIPVYNSIKGLAECLDSVLAQTYTNLEIILVDDGSEDGSTELCREYEKKDDRIRLIIKENNGVSAARNLGMREAKGTYLQFVDSDDCLYQNACEILVQNMKENPVDVVVCGYKTKKRGELRRPKPGLYEDLTELMPSFRSYYNHENNTINVPWNKLYRREAIHATFPEDLSKGEDLFFNLDVLEEINGILFIGDVLYLYNDNNEQSLATKYREDGFNIEERLYNRVLVFYRHHASNRRYHFLDACYLDGIKGKCIALVRRSGKDKKECIQILRTWVRRPSVRRLLRFKKGFGKRDLVFLYMIQFCLAGQIYRYYEKRNGEAE